MNPERMATSCNLCGTEALVDKKEQIVYASGAVDEVFSRRCFLCKNLLFARIKRTRKGDYGDDHGK